MTFQALEKGQGLLEYGLIIIIVAVLVIALLFLLGDRLGLIYSNIIDIV